MKVKLRSGYLVLNALNFGESVKFECNNRAVKTQTWVSMFTCEREECKEYPRKWRKLGGDCRQSFESMH